MEKRRMVYTTKEGIVEAMTFVYNNAQDNTARQLAEKLGVSYGSVNMVLKTMRKAGIDVKTSGKRQVSSLYREAIEEFKNLLSEGLV